MLSMKAGLQGNKELQKLLSAFSRLIQGKIFRNGEIEIPLFQEMELIEFYLLLQGERFAGKITYDILCSEEVKKCQNSAAECGTIGGKRCFTRSRTETGKRSYQGGSKRRKWEAVDSDQR